MSQFERDKYPLDLTGKRSGNRVEGEVHNLFGGDRNRALVPNHGAFYTKDLVVRDDKDGKKLSTEDDYVPVFYYEEPSSLSGKEVCTGIIVTNEDVSDTVRIDYQVVGGMYSMVTSPLIDLIEEALDDSIEVKWGDVLGKPSAFPPSPHYHELQNIFGFEHVVSEIEQLTRAVRGRDLQGYEARQRQLVVQAANIVKDEVIKEVKSDPTRAMVLTRIHETSSGE